LASRCFWASVSVAGRPGTGFAFKAPKPRLVYALIQRDTVLCETPSERAIADRFVFFSALNSRTACRRRRSNCLADPKGLIPSITPEGRAPVHYL
jgi:hypothetical protein